MILDRIVLTDIGAQKEYYDVRAYLVSPYDVVLLVWKVVKALNEHKGATRT